MATLLPSAQLAAIRSGGGFFYRLTSDDVLWMARMAAFEGGEPADTFWALTQRFVWFDEKDKKFPTIGDLAQAFSQPINPKWARNGKFCAPGGRYHGTDHCSKAKLKRRSQARKASLTDLEQRHPEVISAAKQWAQGLLRNPVPRATNFADPSTAKRYLDRASGAAKLLERGNVFIVEKEAREWPSGYVFMEAVSGAIADASGVSKPPTAVALSKGLSRTLTDWWRLT